MELDLYTDARLSRDSTSFPSRTIMSRPESRTALQPRTTVPNSMLAIV
jgi:hypothetical protein